MALTADRCQETTTTTGTGAITLAGAVSGYQSFATAFGSGGGLSIEFAVVSQGGTDWMVCHGAFNGTTGLTIDKVLSSSTGSNLTRTGTYNVFPTIAAATIHRAATGRNAVPLFPLP